MNAPWDDVLREITGLRGVVGALIVSADDGLVVAESAIDGLATGDVAALATALVHRAGRCLGAVSGHGPEHVQLQGERGALLASAGPPPLWLVAMTDADAEVGRLRLLLRDFAGVLG